MNTIVITGDINPQIAQALMAIAQAINPKYKVEYTNSAKNYETKILSEQTILDLKNAESIGVYKSHDDLINEIKKEAY